MKSSVKADLWNSQSGWWGTFTEIKIAKICSVCHKLSASYKDEFHVMLGTPAPVPTPVCRLSQIRVKPKTYEKNLHRKQKKLFACVASEQLVASSRSSLV